MLLAPATIGWCVEAPPFVSFGVAVTRRCTLTATRFFERALDMREQRYLIAYPVTLLYSCFAMITVF